MAWNSENWLLTLIRLCHTILLQVKLRLSFLVHGTLAIQDFENKHLSVLWSDAWRVRAPWRSEILLIYDIFKTQTTGKYQEHSVENNIAHIQRPSNLTYIFQPLDLKVNVFTKKRYEITVNIMVRKRVNKWVKCLSFWYWYQVTWKRDGWLVCTTSWVILVKWSKMLQSWRQLTTRSFQMRIHLSTYQKKNIFYEKRNYLNYLNCKSYGIPSSHNVRSLSKNWVKKRPNFFYP